MASHELIDAIASHFIASAARNGFNGIRASILLRLQPEPNELRKQLATLVESGKITAVFSRFDSNMYIKRFPDIPIEDQLKLLIDEKLDEFCLYPTASTVATRVNLTEWADRPFAKALLLAEPQLWFRAFDMATLERYVSDPRYFVQFFDYMGRMSVEDEFFTDAHHPERDKVSLQSFGLGFDEHENPHVVVYLRYLARLSSEHQQYWNSYISSADVRMSRPYFESSIEGEFWTNRSVRYAISEEMRLIREITEAVWGISLFRSQTHGDVPIGLTSFLRPTAENFNRFVMALDKLLSENINSKFFDDKVPLQTESLRPDGKVVIENKGTLRLLEEWLLREVAWDSPDDFRETVIRPLREVRRLRQKPAHTFTKNDFSAEYHADRRQLLCDVFISLSNIRATLAKHPQASHIKVPDWLNGDDIDVF